MQVCSLHRLGRRLLIDRRLLLTSVAARIFPFLPPSLPATAKLAPITRPLCLWATINHHRRTAGGPSSPAYRPGDVWRCWLGGTRSYCSLTDDDVRKEVEEITALFFEARELLDDARASANTVYFNEDMQDARTAVEEAVRQYTDLLSRLSETQTRRVVAAIGLKMEELKAQLVAISEELDTHI